jgi:hypothetical protein
MAEEHPSGMHNRPLIAVAALMLGVGYFAVLLPARMAAERRADERVQAQRRAAEQQAQREKQRAEMLAQADKRRDEFEAYIRRYQFASQMEQPETQEPQSVPADRVPDPGPLRVAGRLLNSNDAPVAGAEVEVFTLEGSFDQDAPLRAGRRLASGTTNGKGVFKLRVHWPGEVWVAAKDSKGRVANVALDLTPTGEQVGMTEEEEALFGKDAPDLFLVGDLTLGRAPRVRGYVVDADDRGVPKAKVQLTAGDVVTYRTEVVTDAEGGFWVSCRTYPCHIEAKTEVRGEESYDEIDAVEGTKPSLTLYLAQFAQPELAER